jgi:hypothetical protein
MRFTARFKTAVLCTVLVLASVFVCGCGSAPKVQPESPSNSAATAAAAVTPDPSAAAEPEPTAEPSPTPKPTELPGVRLGIKTYTAETKTIDISGEHITFEELRGAAPGLPGVKKLRLGLTPFSKEELEELTALFPDAEISWSVEVLGETVSSDTETLSYPEIKSEDVPALCAALEKLPGLETLELIPAKGATPLTTEELRRISAAAPGARIDCVFSLYGKLAGPDTEELRYYRKKIGDKGIEVFREALPYLHSLKLLRLSDCGITDNDSMAALRADFPEVNVVWSIVIAGSRIMTDTTLIHTPLLRDKHVHLLQYFPDVLYMDIGHNKYLTSIDFLKYLPKLTVFIMAITQIKDISPLANCPDLEFLELFTTPIDDISVLSSLTKLEYLNIGTMHNLSDISPIYGLTSLKMVRICGSSFNHVTKAQVAELKAALPECFVSDGPGDPTTAGGWRYDENHKYTPRYALLRKQMLYYRGNWKDRVSNSPSA